MNSSTRRPAVAGSFYPALPRELMTMVDGMLDVARRGARAEAHTAVHRTPPKALIVPHAGYVYSGPIAASAYALLQPFADIVERVVLVGPAHHVYVDGVAAPGAAALHTPLGDVAVDETAITSASQIIVSPRAHAPEHSLEVQLPFLQRVLPRATVVPLLVSDASAEEVGRVLEALWGGPETVIVISSDLSHYLPYDTAHSLDGDTAARIVRLDPLPLPPDRACGSAGINGLLWVARRKGLRPRLIDLRSSGDTAGPRDRVVGYGAFALEEAGHAA